MEEYLKAVSEMYSQFKQREAHPMEKYVGRLARRCGEKMEVVGYSDNKWSVEPLLIVEASQNDGWQELGPFDVVLKECEYYGYVSISDLVDWKIMEKYSKAVSEMYSQFKQREAHPMEKYVGRLANFQGIECEVVGCRGYMDGTWVLIVDGTKVMGWGRAVLDTRDVIFKECERYSYAGINDLIVQKL